MNDDVYLKLLERLNENPRKYQPIDEVSDFLKLLFTLEQVGVMISGKGYF